MRVKQEVIQHLFKSWWLIGLLCLVALTAQAQSTEMSAPTPVSANDVSGSITARDIGDSRLTHHFFAFTGTPGDVLITVRSNNLNGDVDVFTAGTLRPLLKFSLYAESSSPTTKGIYLRRREDLVLRVEARTPNDDAGNYQIRFGGTFEPMPGSLVAEAETKPAEPIILSTTKGRRVSSSGARINEPTPPAEVVVVAPAVESPSPIATPERTPEPETARISTPRRGRVRTPARRTPTRPATEAPAAATTDPTVEETKPAEVAKTEPEPSTATPPRRAGRRGRAATATPAPVEAEPPSGPRLLIELLDGTRVEQYMSVIRRVTVENNQIVVVRKDGKIDRTRLSDVVKMTIEP